MTTNPIPLLSNQLPNTSRKNKELPRKFSLINYPDLILFWLALPSDLNAAADSPSDEDSTDLAKELERSA